MVLTTPNILHNTSKRSLGAFLRLGGGRGWPDNEKPANAIGGLIPSLNRVSLYTVGFPGRTGFQRVRIILLVFQDMDQGTVGFSELDQGTVGLLSTR